MPDDLIARLEAAAEGSREKRHLMTWPRGEMCGGCAGRKGTEANGTAQTMADFEECVRTGEPFYCHDSVAVRDDDGWATDKHGNRYRRLPQSQWRMCRAWMTARAALLRAKGAEHGTA